MMLAEEHYEPSHSSSHSSQDFLKADRPNKRPATRDHDPDTSYKRFKSSPPHLDDIDRKISLAGKENIPFAV